jgi:ribonuclease BN (tRNA processing enzyme)
VQPATTIARTAVRGTCRRAVPAPWSRPATRSFLIDAGRGATIRLYQLKLPIGRIDVQFLTHYHSDHTSGVPDVWLTGWQQGRKRAAHPTCVGAGQVGARDQGVGNKRAPLIGPQ